MKALSCDTAADNNYVAEHGGGWLLEFGEMHQIRGQAFMLVSDLDDTMFGDDQASKDFKDFWERDARLRGSSLVYNTGRALDKWLSLWREKQWCLAAPDYLITSVGTKVFKAAPDVRPKPYVHTEGFTALPAWICGPNWPSHKSLHGKITSQITLRASSF